MPATATVPAHVRSFSRSDEEIIIGRRRRCRLDGKHVVFGEVMGEASMAVVRKIEASKTDGRDKPEAEVKIVKSGEIKMEEGSASSE